MAASSSLFSMGATLTARAAVPCPKLAPPRLPGRFAMNFTRIVGVLLLIAGTASLATGGFSYTKDSTVVKLGPLELSAKEKEEVKLPVWLGVGAIAGGGLLLVLGGRKR